VLTLLVALAALTADARAQHWARSRAVAQEPFDYKMLPENIRS
jgi:hypothetical protein